MNQFGGVMDCVLISSVVENEAIRPKSGCFRIRIMCPEWSDMSTSGLLFQ